MASILVLNGVNLGELGTRRPEVYGTLTLHDIESRLKEEFTGVDLDFRQTDSEAEMVRCIKDSAAFTGVLINAGAWTHYAYALHDALEQIHVPKVEVHISNVHRREEWRRHSVISPAVDAVVAGMGLWGYVAGVRYVLERASEGG